LAAPTRAAGDASEIVAPGGEARREADGVREAAAAARGEFEAARVAADEFGLAVSSAFNSIGQRGVDLVVDGLTSGKFAFKDFADFAIKELTRLAVSSVFTQIVGLLGGGLFGGGGGGLFGGGGGGLFGGGGGGLFGSLFGGLFADGAAFRGGNVVPFARGGVVESPTLFPMSRGRTGLMGEAGPEAIMPLHRLPNGGLGVAAASGGGGQVIHVNYVANIDARGADREGLTEVKQQIAQDRATFKLRVVEAVQEGSKKRMLR
jgi:lambda family phage tail tape measure protein